MLGYIISSYGGGEKNDFYAECGGTRSSTTEHSSGIYLQLYGGGGYFQHDDDTQIKNNARNGYILFHIDIKKDSIGIYCLFCMRVFSYHCESVGTFCLLFCKNG